MKSALPLAVVLFACAGPRAQAPSPAQAQHGVALRFIEDDYSRALAQAKATRRPLFVDAWAPW